MFLEVLPGNAVLSDLNAALIETFRQVRRSPGLIARYLARHAHSNSEDYYYSVRRTYNATQNRSAAQAARFVYLNRTCFNGIFRVNLRGEYNVPYGKLTRPLFPSRSHLQKIAYALQSVTLQVADYRDALKAATAGDFLYIDPPYPPLNGTSFFRHYTPERFSDEDQKALAECLEDLSERGCAIMISNADTPRIRQLYKAFHIGTLPVTRSVSCKNEKTAVQELVITNY